MLLKDKLEPYRLLLASQSPRRRELMTGCGLPYEPAPKYECEEIYPGTLPAGEVPLFLSRLKSEAYPAPLGANDILLTADTVVISVAAGISIARLQAAVAGRCPVVRCMPNTPALVGKGVFALCFDDKVPAESKEDILRFFSQLGVCLELPESRFTAFSALIGAGPAYVFGMMQGLVQAGVTVGQRTFTSELRLTATIHMQGVLGIAHVGDGDAVYRQGILNLSLIHIFRAHET